ncbi:unnamed protein product [Strongylus vulgaris]|uniref:CWH43-like N-terminal domain-containing protein n=1 Tax=Strongylus vulgaris TaxID=40348 RepID=A0A3P7LMR1_STRVU|nr:unnamed protein product [Strongylus vulgaris]
MILHRIWLLPILTVVFGLGAMLSGYVIEIVTLNRFPALLPCNGDNTTSIPESAVFGQILNMAAILYALTIYVVHLQIEEFYGQCLQWNQARWFKFSTLLMFVGFASAFGLMLVANFRHSDILAVHLLGAMMAFIGMLIYGWGHVIFR